MSLTEKIRKLVYARDNRRCVACASSQQLTIQHRVSKGMGGSKLFDTAPYLLTFCWGCNIRLEQDSAFAELGRANGWKINRNQNPPINPSEVPVNYYGDWWLLLENGKRIKTHG